MGRAASDHQHSVYRYFDHDEAQGCDLMKRHAFILTALIALLGATLACSTRQEEIAAFGAAIEITATARAASGTQSGSVNVATAEAQATEGIANADVTATSSGGTSPDDEAATAAAEQPIIDELPTYGVDPAAGGQVAWIHPPEELVVTDGAGYDYINRFAGIIARDFVLSGDITWNTQFGTSGCGFVVRSNGDEEALDQYLALITRAGSGTLFFSPMVDGVVQTAFGTEIDLIDQGFQDQNDTTNRLTVVAQGSHFKVFTNGILINEYDYTEFERGFILMVAVAESGETRCKFDNTWLWLISQ
jgi:hypothetical protein